MTRKVYIKDQLRIRDSISGLNIRGFVHIYEQNRQRNLDRLLRKGSNLILYQGREALLEALIRRNRTENGAADMFVSWMGVVDGAATLDDPFNPTLATLFDTELGHPLIVNQAKSEYADGGRKIPIVDVQFRQDPDFDDRYLIVDLYGRIEANDLENQPINEVGLYMSDSNNAATATKFLLFAKYTFPTIVKQPNMELIIVWTLFI